MGWYNDHIKKCDDGEHTSCSIHREYYPIADQCPIHGRSHDSEKDKCKLWVDGVCLHTLFHEAFYNTFRTCDSFWYSKSGGHVTMSAVLIHTSDNKWGVVLDIGKSYALSERVSKDCGFNQRTYFEGDEFDDFKKFLKILYKKRNEIYERALKEYKCTRCRKSDDRVAIYGKNRLCDGCVTKIATGWERDFRIKCLWKGCDGIINITRETYSASMPESEGAIQECGWMVHTLVCPKCGNSVGNIDISPDGWITYAPDGKHTDESKIGIHVKKVIDGKEKQVMIDIKKESKRRYLKEWARPWTKKEHDKWKKKMDKDIAKEKRDAQ